MEGLVETACVKLNLLHAQNNYSYTSYPPFVVAQDSSSGKYKEPQRKQHGYSQLSSNPTQARLSFQNTKRLVCFAPTANSAVSVKTRNLMQKKLSVTFLLTCRIRVHFYETYNCLWEVRRPANRRALSTQTTPAAADWT